MEPQTRNLPNSAHSYILRFIVALTSVLFVAVTPLFAHGDVIDSFLASIHVRPDGSAEVVETIHYDFGADKLHGIYRDIPIIYKDASGSRRSVTIDNIVVVDGKFSPIMFESFKNGDNLRIKIGDPDVLVTGKKTYEITYVAHDVVGFFDEYDELYWNVTGNGWTFSIASSSARVYAPASSTQAACYRGALGSSEPCASLRAISADGTEWYFQTGRVLPPGEGLTVSVGWPKGIVAPPSEALIILRAIANNLILLVPVVVFFVLFRYWRLHGKDAKGRGTIIPEYDAPDDMSPATMSEILHLRVTPGSVSATIVRLAVRGFLKITREDSTTLAVFTSTTYRFDKLKAADDSLSKDEVALLQALFGEKESVTSVELSESRDLHSGLQEIQRIVGIQVVARGYFRANPTAIRIKFIVLTVFALVLGVFLAIAIESGVAFIAAVISAGVIGFFGMIMPAKTHKGALTKEHILGLKDYLQIAEKDRLDFHNAPEKSPALFEKLLPYAMVLGVSAAWAKEFEGLYKEPPSWYAGGAYPVFTATAFADDMSNMSTSVASMTASPTSGGGGSGGGGSSGGGFGGGGGGSW